MPDFCRKGRSKRARRDLFAASSGDTDVPLRRRPRLHMRKATRAEPTLRKGYVMHMEGQAGHPPVYVKIELAAGKVYGRSFHYSDRSGGDW